ncbi:hypothetical protein E2493_17225 [Sphingomonas parva]|uniref:DUF1570 domain-containing protein n=1 Tax=Sphingomonas parva TaxID=2555898 RepID=A0A4Y8ZPH1_9SPHN|nr:hypothetical protein [Sphingomonas parva]TFI57035.1 hypothetical protein E2493_17225 [Sphingomonas parva]
MRYLPWKISALTALAVASPAPAEWREARTDHFILTIDDTEEGARDFATRLERFDAALRSLYGVPDNPDQHARPLEIYALKDGGVYGTCGYTALGCYKARPDRSLIFSMHMPGIDKKTKTGWWSSQTVLLHEYGHHFAFSNFPTAYPYWFSEGFAEFNANATFEPDGSIIIGYPANYRAEGLKSGNRLSAKQLFDPIRYRTPDLDLLYGRGWLLTHYAMLDTARKKQLAAYLEALNKGVPSLQAAEQSFGDLKQLNDALDAYAKGRLQSPLYVAPDPKPVRVTVTTLSPGQAEMLPLHIAFTVGVQKDYRLGPAMKAAKIAARFPDDAVVQTQWAVAEHHAGRLDRADKAADAALALKPDHVDALVRKGLIAVSRATKTKATDAAAWSAARAWFLKANRADPNAVMPLYLYYTSFAAADAKPTPGAVKGLMRAAALAPESTEIRVQLARQMLTDGDAATARALLQRSAFTPHRERDENLARQLVDLIDAGKVEEAKALMKAKEDEAEKED